MRKIATWLAVISILSFCWVTDSAAQRGMKWQGSGNWGPGSSYNQMFDPKTMETLTGEVVSVDLKTPIKGMSQGVHLVVKTARETISVHLGPAWYLERQDFKIEAKEMAEIRGSRITFEGKPAIIASEVKTANGVMKLREENGFPVWSGWRRR